VAVAITRDVPSAANVSHNRFASALLTAFAKA
jgi:hypothetical protein